MHGQRHQITTHILLVQTHQQVLMGTDPVSAYPEFSGLCQPTLETKSPVELTQVCMLCTDSRWPLKFVQKLCRDRMENPHIPQPNCEFGMGPAQESLPLKSAQVTL